MFSGRHCRDIRAHGGNLFAAGQLDKPCPATVGAYNQAYNLADVLRSGGLVGTLGGLPTPTDPAYGGVGYRGDQASVAGDLTVGPIDVDVLLGDEPVTP